MKVGTDGVLLGAWTRLRGDERLILDIGTGTGLIALMMAQRVPRARVMGVDVADVSQARENAAASPWGERLSFVQQPVQEFVSSRPFDLILSNPPYFVDSLHSPDVGRTQARHAVTLPFEELILAVRRLLAPEGRFAVILPSDEAVRFCRVAASSLEVIRRTDVRTTPRRVPKRTLLEFGHLGVVHEHLSQTELVIGTGEHESYTDAYRDLTRDFYLKF